MIFREQFHTYFATAVVLSSNYLKTLLTKTIVLSRNTLKNIVSNGDYTAKKLFKNIVCNGNFAGKEHSQNIVSNETISKTFPVQELAGVDPQGAQPSRQQEGQGQLLVENLIKDVQRSPEDMTMMNHTAGVMGGRTFVANM